jgi:hypothetical protein
VRSSPTASPLSDFGVERKVVAYPAARSMHQALEMARHDCRAGQVACHCHCRIASAQLIACADVRLWHICDIRHLSHLVCNAVQKADVAPAITPYRERVVGLGSQ